MILVILVGGFVGLSKDVVLTLGVSVLYGLLVRVDKNGNFENVVGFVDISLLYFE